MTEARAQPEQFKSGTAADTRNSYDAKITRILADHVSIVKRNEYSAVVDRIPTPPQLEHASVAPQTGVYVDMNMDTHLAGLASDGLNALMNV